jgi:hypothetical protein
MKLHILHDDGLWSPPHPISGSSLELRQYSTCKACGRIRFRTIGLYAQGRFDAEIADCNRSETLQATATTEPGVPLDLRRILMEKAGQG